MRRAVLLFLALAACSLSAASDDRAGTGRSPAVTTEAGWTAVRLDASNVVGLVSGGAELYALAQGIGPDGFYVSKDGGLSWFARGELHTYYGNYRGLAFGGGTLIAWNDSGYVRSIDRGRTWTPGWVQGFTFESVVPDGPREFVGFGTSAWPAPATPAFVRSSDGGRSWFLTRLPRPGEVGLRLSVSPRSSAVIYALTRRNDDASSCRVLRSLNGGGSWRDVTGVIGTSTPIHDVVADASDPKRVWVAAFSGLYRSDDLGTTWHNAPGLKSVWRVMSDPRIPGSVLAAGVGKTWRVGGEGSAIWMMLPVTGARGIPNALLPLERSELLGGTAGVFRNGSAPWSASSAGLTSRIVRPVAISRSDPKVVYASIRSDGIYRSGDAGLSWVRLPDHPWIRTLSSLQVDPANSNVVYAASPEYGAFRSRTGGRSWTRLVEGPFEVFEVDPAAPLRLAAGESGWRPALRISVDGGQTWTRRVLPDYGAPLVALAFGPGATIYAGGYYLEEYGPEDYCLGFLARSDDDGRSWRLLGDKVVSRIAASPSKPQRLYILEAAGAVSVSDDGGRTWTRLPIREAGGTVFPLRDFAVHMGTQDRVLAIKFEGSVFSWTAGEARWTRVTPARAPVYDGSLAWHPESGLALLTERTDFLRRTDLIGQ